MHDFYGAVSLPEVSLVCLKGLTDPMECCMHVTFVQFSPDSDYNTTQVLLNGEELHFVPCSIYLGEWEVFF